MKYLREPPWVRTVVDVDRVTYDKKRRLRDLRSVLTKSRPVTFTIGYARPVRGFASRTVILLSRKVVTGTDEIGWFETRRGCQLLDDERGAGETRHAA